MTIDLHEITIRELCASYEDLSIQEEGITGYNGRLNIRPKYQREFVYDEKKRNAVMDTVWQNFPLNVMYWVRVGEDEYDIGLCATERGKRRRRQGHGKCDCLGCSFHAVIRFMPVRRNYIKIRKIVGRQFGGGWFRVRRGFGIIFAS